MGGEVKQPGPRPSWPGLLREKTAAGTIRWRVRVEGDKHRRIRLPVAPGERGFEEAYWAARAGRQPGEAAPKTDRQRGTLDELVGRYLAALEAKVEAGNASPLTLKGHRSLLKRVSDVLDDDGDRLGSLDADMPREAFIHIQDSFGARTGAADNAVKALRAAYRWGRDRGFPRANDLFEMEKIHRSKGGAIPWSADDAKAFMKAHGPGSTARLWFWLAVNTMARIGTRRHSARTWRWSFPRGGSWRGNPQRRDPRRWPSQCSRNLRRRSRGIRAAPPTS